MKRKQTETPLSKDDEPTRKIAIRQAADSIVVAVDYPDDIIFSILSFLDSSWFILKKCSLISKQWFKVIQERAELNLEFTHSPNESEQKRISW